MGDIEYSTSVPKLLPGSQLIFGDSFVEDHAGQLITNPNIALIELVANSFDAGADRINITWPEELGESFVIEDNGTGMTAEEFEYRWLYLNYNRNKEQGAGIIFPPGNRSSKRKTFGKNGKGRLSAFCFNDEYQVETWRNGTSSLYLVKRNHNNKAKPYDLVIQRTFPKDGHGTKIKVRLTKHNLEIDSVKCLLWSKFITDPAVEIMVNGITIDLLSLEDHIEFRIAKTNWGDVTVYFIPGGITGRTSLQNGITWWVNGKSVGDISWERMSERGKFIDRRTVEGKRFTFIVQADILEEYVKFDWSEFSQNETKPRSVLQKVENLIEEWLRELTRTTRQDEKRRAIQDNREKIQELPKYSQELVGNFISAVQDKIPTLGQEAVSKAVSVFCTIEAARNGRELLSQLAKLKPQDMDLLYEILKKWSIRDAKVVLDELHWRLDLLNQLQQLVENKNTLELQQLQPLFAKGLWIFGAEFEDCRFTSNRSLNTAIQSLFLPEQKANISSEMSKKRPDFVVLPNSTIGSYSRPSFDWETSEIIGIDKAVIVELKRGGFEITNQEIRQAEDYAIEILKSAKVIASRGCISCFVLGAKVAPMTSPIKLGVNEEILVTPWPYSTILEKAHARTFNLLRHLQDVRPDISYDPDVDEALTSYYQQAMDFSSKESNS